VFINNDEAAGRVNRKRQMKSLSSSSYEISFSHSFEPEKINEDGRGADEDESKTVHLNDISALGRT